VLLEFAAAGAEEVFEEGESDLDWLHRAWQGVALASVCHTIGAGDHMASLDWSQCRHSRAGAGCAGFCSQERCAPNAAITRRMKIILDESAPQKLRLLIDSRHIVVTTWYQGWSGFKNGALLAAAEEAGFDLFLTADQEIS